MSESARSRHLVSIARYAVLLYILLLAIGTRCMLVHVEHAQRHQHGEGSSSPQEAFCDWVCQATADTAVASGPAPTVTELIVGPAEIPTHQLVSSVRFFSDRPRAPPGAPLVSLVEGK